MEEPISLSSPSTADGTPSASSSTDELDYECIVIGAGISGLYQLYRLRELGMRVRVIENGADVGGTWYWNRYPGARFDSETVSYQLSFSPELLAEWDWKERFAPQAETLAYLNHVADRFDLRRDIQFSSHVNAAHYNDATRMWKIVLTTGEAFHSRFLVTAVGPLSAPTLPRYDGLESFQGESFHTANWPHSEVRFEGKRVGVIGTGATGIQTIQEIAKTVGHLTVFQRTPNWSVPLHNAPIKAEEMVELRKGYPAMWTRLKRAFAGFLHDADPRGTFEVSEEEREKVWERLYDTPGFALWQGNFRDTLRDPAANELLSQFVARKTRERLEDPIVAEKLIPKNHGFGTRRVPLESGYFEVYNQDNVELVDIKQTPIECVTEKGIKTVRKEYELDMIIYATGFDALTGGFDKIDIRGIDGARLKERWKGGPKTYLGVMCHGFPNMLMVMGPHSALGNIPRSVEYNVEWVTGLLKYARDHDITKIEARKERVDEWTSHVNELGTGMLSANVDSWMTGVNSNVEGKQTRYVARYAGSGPVYRARCDRIAAEGYREVSLS